MRLTKRDMEHVREVARELREEWDAGDEEATSEVVMLSTGYADVQIDPDGEGAIEVVQHGVSYVLPLDPAEDEDEEEDDE